VSENASKVLAAGTKATRLLTKLNQLKIFFNKTFVPWDEKICSSYWCNQDKNGRLKLHFLWGLLVLRLALRKSHNP
jgi:hypothetical protein